MVRKTGRYARRLGPCSGLLLLDQRMAMDDRAVALAHLYEEVALIVIVALMVSKPF